jgi:outer membrane protein OmpA-like peptidoglycan-associated protein
LSFARGTFVRRWTVGASTSGAESLLLGNAWTTDGPFAGNPEFVFELPAVAQLARIDVTADLPPGATATLRFGVATQNDEQFTDGGAIALTPSTSGDSSGTLQGPIVARWLRVRIERSPGAKIRIASLSATGSVAVPSAPLGGRWTLADYVPGSNDIVFGTLKGLIPKSGTPTGNYHLATLVAGDRLVATACNYERDVWRGTISGGSAALDSGGQLNSVAGGSLLVGTDPNGQGVFARRTSSAPACDVPAAGNGPVATIIERRNPGTESEIADPALIPGHRFEHVLLPLLQTGTIDRTKTVVLAFSCTTTTDTTPEQQRALIDFVARGGVLVIRDADSCPKSEYAFVPYPFTTSATGARGARGSVLSIADSSVLAGSDPADKQHYIDTEAYLHNQSQQIGDADIMQTTDDHWCGLMFAKNAAGSSGWIRAYARYGKGIIVYDGFDVDDLRAQIPQAELLNRLAYGLSPDAELPCNAHVASQLMLLSSVHRSVPFGQAQDVRIGFTVDHEGVTTPERVTLSIDGESAPGWRATVDRRDLMLGAAEQRVLVTVHVPRNATASRHLYTLTATGEGGRGAKAAIQFDVNEALAKQLERGGRARIYGIHFDVASDRIQPQSGATIAEIANVLRSHPTWRMRVEGYTDSDGGAAYNVGLSDRRANAVVKVLVAREHIARGRLRAEGFGLTHPVASNATDAGKALNRRVELVRF